MTDWSNNMIKRFGFKNFGSFKEGSEISFEFDGKTPIEVSNGGSIGTVLGIKGGNGSGKTNILKALTFFYIFVSHRNKVSTLDSQNSVKIPIDTFFYSDAPAEFYIEYVDDDVTYFYELEVKQSGIDRESLSKTVKRETVVFERNKNAITSCLKSLDELKMIKLSSDRTVISLVKDYKFNKPLVDLKKFNVSIGRMLSNVNYHGIEVNESKDIYYFSNHYQKDPKALDFMVKVLKKADSGIDSVTIEEGKTESGDTFYFPLFHHIHNGRKRPLKATNESQGNNVIYRTMLKYWLVLQTGGVLIHDEFDIHLHALILPSIIDLFTSEETNPHNAQLIITAHNTEIIDSLGRYRTVLVNKEDNESYCYRLDELSMLRNDRQISPFYMSGKIGGVPTQ